MTAQSDFSRYNLQLNREFVICCRSLKDQCIVLCISCPRRPFPILLVILARHA